MRLFLTRHVPFEFINIIYPLERKSSSYTDLIVYIKQTAAVVWSEDDEELKNVTDIYEYL